MTLSERLGEFVEWGKGKYAARTVAQYAWACRKYVDFMDDAPAESADVMSVVAFQGHLRDMRWEESSVANAMLSLRQFFRFMFLRRAVDWDYQLIPVPKYVTRQYKSLEPDEVRAMVDGIRTDRFAGLRDKAVVMFLHATGMRVTECANLDVSDVNPDRMEAVVVTLKTRARRTVFWDVPTRDVLRRYLAERPLWTRGKALWIALDRRTGGNRLSVRSIERIFERHRLREGVSPHVMRHTYGTDLAVAEIDVRPSQRLMGHKNIRSTQTYSQLRDPELRRAYDRMVERRRKTAA